MSRSSKENGNLLGNTSGNSLGNTSGNSLGNTSGNSLGNTSGNSLGNTSGNSFGNTSGNSEVKCISSTQSQVSNKVMKERNRKRYNIIIDLGVHECI